MRAEGDFRDTLYTINKRGERNWVYAHYLPGKLFNLRMVVGYLLMAFYIGMPWISIGGMQAVHLDIAHRRFVFFGLELWATDTIFLFLALGMMAMSLFFFTSIFGRIWCGWACPETIFLELLFRPIERLIEGSDSQRRRLDAAPWTATKVLKKLLKHSHCAAAAWILASTSLAYFFGREMLISMMMEPPLANPLPFFLTLAYMGVLAFQFGWFREQFCTILCPYARFQSVLMDQNSLLVGYDYKRGEPRGKLRDKNNEEKVSGDCIDCGLCVRVCPTGIDIRNGTQLECVACSACIDACDSVMLKINKPPGLIKYSTEKLLAEDSSKSWLNFLIRPRVIVYSLILTILGTVFTYKLTTRSTVDIEIIRASLSAPFTADSQTVVNQFSLRISNKGNTAENFSISLPMPEGLSFISPLSQITLTHGQSQTVPVFISAPLDLFKRGKLKARIIIESSGGGKAIRNLTLIGPER